MIKTLENCQSAISKRARFLSKKLCLKYTYSLEIIKKNFDTEFTKYEIGEDYVPIECKRDKISLFIKSYCDFTIPEISPITNETIFQHINREQLAGLWDEEVEIIYDALFNDQDSWLMYTIEELLEKCDNSLKYRVHRFVNSEKTYDNGHIIDHRLGISIYYVLRKNDGKTEVILREIEPFFTWAGLQEVKLYSKPYFRQYIDLYIEKIANDIRTLKIDALLSVEYICGFHCLASLRQKEKHYTIYLKRASDIASFNYIEESLRKKGAFDFKFGGRTFLTIPIPVS
ncbi:MAG: hypothetical protein ACJAS1_005400 [Oleiphilaceae bacterium]|jgi:hypothetical protein